MLLTNSYDLKYMRLQVFWKLSYPQGYETLQKYLHIQYACFLSDCEHQSS